MTSVDGAHNRSGPRVTGKNVAGRNPTPDSSALEIVADPVGYVLIRIEITNEDDADRF